MAWICFLWCACVDRGTLDSQDSATSAPVQTGRYDTHMHVRSGGTDTLLAMMDDADVDRVLLTNVPETNLATPGNSFCESHGLGELGDDQRLLEAAWQDHPDRLGLLAGGGSLGPLIQCTDPDRSDDVIDAFRDRAQTLIDTPGFAGFGEMISLHLCMSDTHSYQVALADHPLFIELGHLAAAAGVPIDLHMEAVPEGGLDDPELLAGLNDRCALNPDDVLPATIPPLLALLEQTGATVVWQHIGWDNTGSLTPDVLRQVLADCDAQAGAGACPLAFGLRVAPDPGHNPLVVFEDGEPTTRLKAEWASLIAEYPDRFTLGADEFVGNGDLPAAFSNTWALLGELDEATAAAVGGGNAARIYGL